MFYWHIATDIGGDRLASRPMPTALARRHYGRASGSL